MVIASHNNKEQNERDWYRNPGIDIFAGPGGLGEGFASLDDGSGKPRFKSVVSIERDEYSHRTLHLRHFLRTFQEGFPDEYYQYL
jgi:DNA (cytosine-5)-methyltransferase 1